MSGANLLAVPPEISYCKIGKEMSSLYFRLDVFFLFEARVPGFDALFGVLCILYIAQLLGGRGRVSNSGTPAEYSEPKIQ
jgi:hypothetical protein